MGNNMFSKKITFAKLFFKAIAIRAIMQALKSDKYIIVLPHMYLTFKNYCSGSGAARLAHTLGVREVAGSNPVSPTLNTALNHDLLDLHNILQS